MQPSVLMKATAACLLFQPQRAARDYRGLISEFEKSIFLDDQDVRVYHAVAYLYYRLEFLWRNQKIDNDNKTFRYYILAGIGINATGGRNIFTMTKSKIPETYGRMIAVFKDEEKLKKEISDVMVIIDEQIRDMGIVGQERIRDTIRSESFSKTFFAKAKDAAAKH